MFTAVIYDLDDLLVDSHALHVEATHRILRQYNSKYPLLSKQQQQHFVGMRVKDILQELLPVLNLPIPLEELDHKREDIFLKLVKGKLELMPGALSSLQFFRQQQWKIALGSSGTKKYINTVLGKFSLQPYFTVMVSGEDVRKGKPDPEVYVLAAKKLKVLPPECLVLEDATNGILAAKAAGCVCLAVKNAHTPAQDFSQADKVINSLEEIKLSVIKSL